jgi:hypothetical protein
VNALASQLLWADGGYMLSMAGLEEKPLPWTALAAAIALLTFALAIRRGSWFFSTLASIDALIALVTLGASLESGSDAGPALWAFVCALALAALAAVGRRQAGDRVAIPPAVFAVLLVFSSFGLGLALLDKYGSPRTAFPFLWPYGLIAASFGAAHGLGRAGAKPHRGLALFLGCIMLAIAPSVHALVKDKAHLFLYIATVLGTGLIVAAFHWAPIRDDATARGIAILTGLASVVTAPALNAMRLIDEQGDELFREALELKFGEELMRNPLFYLSYACGTATVLVALGVVFARGEEESESKWPYRLLELAGLVLFFGTLTILSLARWRELLYPAVLFGGGVAALAVGARERHVLLVVIPGAFLLLNAWIQYFAKLHDVPILLLLLGLGLGILGGGVLFEKKVKPYLPKLKTWA